jgi:hypothetical protein
MIGAMRLAAVVVVFALASCDSSECKAPEHTTYNCEPVPAGTPGCIGGPIWMSNQSSGGATHQDDPDKVFPAGCFAEIPDCSPYYANSARTFKCDADVSGGQWGELL